MMSWINKLFHQGPVEDEEASLDSNTPRVPVEIPRRQIVRRSRATGKPPKDASELKRIHDGSDRAVILSLMDGTLDPDQIAGIMTARGRKEFTRTYVMSHFHCLHKDCGIGYEITEDGNALALFPEGKTIEDVLREPEPKPDRIPARRENVKKQIKILPSISHRSAAHDAGHGTYFPGPCEECLAAGWVDSEGKWIPEELQPTRKGRVREAREYDTTSLTERSHGYRVHRDYAAHWFRWGWCARHIWNEHDVLDVGCGEDYAFVKVLIGAYGKGVPRSYVGVDLNPLPRPPYRPWAKFIGEFNFIEDHARVETSMEEQQPSINNESFVTSVPSPLFYRYERPILGLFNRIVCLEVIEHMMKEHGIELLRAMRMHLAPGGKLFLSTPVYDGFAAANHVHEWTIDELREEIVKAGFFVHERFGTFANLRDIKKVAAQEQIKTLEDLNRYYATDVTACFLAPLYPDASRNNMWVLGLNEDVDPFKIEREDQDWADRTWTEEPEGPDFIHDEPMVFVSAPPVELGPDPGTWEEFCRSHGIDDTIEMDFDLWERVLRTTGVDPDEIIASWDRMVAKRDGSDE